MRRRRDIDWALTEPDVITSRLNSKAQTTIPQPVRTALGVAAGDELAYAIEDGRVVLTKAPSRQVRKGGPLATFTEWDLAADRRAYKDL
jgi:antitoxin PrlF